MKLICTPSQRSGEDPEVEIPLMRGSESFTRGSFSTALARVKMHTAYDFSLDADHDLQNLSGAYIYINGIRAAEVVLESDDEGRYRCRFDEKGGELTHIEVKDEAGDKKQVFLPFDRLYKFAHIEVRRGEEVLACSGYVVVEGLENEKAVGEMLELVYRPGSISEWLNTAFPEEHGRPLVAFAFSSGRDSGERVAQRFLWLTEHILDCFDRVLPRIRQRPASRVIVSRSRVRGDQAQHAGAVEALWLARHPEAMTRLPSGHGGAGIEISGDRYYPRYLESERRVTSSDVYENRVLLSFLRIVSGRLGVLESSLLGWIDDNGDLAPVPASQAMAWISGYSGRGGTLAEEEEADEPDNERLPEKGAAVPVEGLIEWIDSLWKRSVGVLRGYSKALSVSQQGMGGGFPRRTKVFQEVESYSLLYECMELWYCSSDFSFYNELEGPRWQDQPAGEVSFIDISRLDRVYEYYLLFELLGWLQSKGFAPDSDEAGRPKISKVPYGRGLQYDDVYPNKYELVRQGDGARAVLFYQPYALCNAGDDNGLGLYRLTKGGAEYPYYHPDFVLVYSKDGVTRRVVLDAKFRDIDDINNHYSERKVFGGQAKLTDLEDVVRKYRFELIDRWGNAPDGVWLLCARGEGSRGKVRPLTGESRNHRGLLDAVKDFLSRCGSALVTPGLAYDVFDEIMGFIKDT